MDIRNCRQCGSIFPFTGQPFCRKCMKREDEDYATVKHYLQQYPHSTLEEVHEETGISRDTILRLLRDGRLEASAGLAGSLTCDWCGRPIDRGRRCQACTDKVQEGLRRVLPPRQGESEGDDSYNRMHTADLIRDRRTR